MRISNIKYQISNIQSGQSMIEMLLALGVAAVVLVALVKVASLSVTSSVFARQKSQATRLGSEALEWARSQRDELGWDGFYAKVTGAPGGVGYCLPSIPVGSPADWGSQAPDEGPGVPLPCGASGVVPNTEFTRWLKVSVLDPAVAQVEISAKVRWSDSKRIVHDSVVSQRLSNWKNK